MAANLPTMVDLAKEYEIGFLEVFHHLKQIGIEKTKSTAQLTAKQAAAFPQRMKTEGTRSGLPETGPGKTSST